jgi:hypothetical protein
MMWEFQELGYDFSINRCQNGTISGDCRTYPKPSAFTFNYHKDQARVALYKVFAAVNNLRATNPVFTTANSSLSLGGIGKRVVLKGGVDGDIIVASNLGIINLNQSFGFTQTGKWYEYWTGDSITVTDVTQRLSMKPGECRIYSTKKLGTVEKGLILATSPAIPQGQAQAYRLLPNPAESRFFIEGPAGALRCNLLSTDGRLVGSQRLTDENRVFDLDALPAGKPAPGMYLLQIENAGNTPSHMRLVVQ